MSLAPLLAAIDVGGTSIKTALLSGRLEAVSSGRSRTPRADGPDAVVRAVAGAAVRLREEAVARTGRAPSGLGVASLGLVDEDAGTAVWSAATRWRDVPLAAVLAAELDLPVRLGHDLRVAARAEAELGGAQDVDPLLFVALGTGIGAAVRWQGHALTGARSRAAELGHLPVPGGDLRCGCGAVGCLETVASASAVARAGSAEAGRPVSAREVAMAAGRGEPWATGVWGRAVSALAAGLAAAAVVLDPAEIVLGGGLSLAGDLLVAPLRRELVRRYPLGDPPPVRVSALRDEAALFGAALLARDAARARAALL